MNTEIDEVSRLAQSLEKLVGTGTCKSCYWFLAKHKNGNRNLCQFEPPTVVPFMAQDMAGRQVMQTVGALPTVDPEEDRCSHWKLKGSNGATAA